ncbi:nuclease-related domain-containing protein [Flavobacterium sp. GCM10027622]|uniref:nuclease-related domain-containing protein n=1 Tax=unclassified Flavobacterium TaxID=196869 RepID=UPI00361120CE
MLEIRRNRFAKPYENEFFRIFSKKLSDAFEKLGIHGVLLGSPVCTLRNDLQLDALLITETGIVIIDFKNYAGIIRLPEKEEDFAKKKWLNVSKNGSTIEINKHSHNPFAQTFKQKEKFDEILINVIKPKILSDENIATRDTYPMVCFQQEITIEGRIPGNFQRIFHITSPSTIISKLTDLLYVAPNEWNGAVKGYKLSQNTFDNLKAVFRADAYNPFEELSMFEEFEKIDFLDYVEEALFIEQQFEFNKATIDDFIDSDIEILQVNCDATPTKIPFVSKIVSYYLEKNKLAEEEKGKIYFLAPTNKHVADLNRDGADFQLQSLYSRLYDFENTTIELMDNAINERETFPLLSNNDPEESLYIIFNAHLVYNFEGNEEDLVKFGSGSLCNDTLTFINAKARKNKIILLNDSNFYGFRAETITSNTILIENNLSYIEISLDCNPLSSNEKTIATIEKKINSGIFNELYWNSNPNIKTLKEEHFKALLKSRTINNQLHKTHILTREKHESEATNSWVRAILKNSGKISQRDVVWIKNKIMLPEVTDPFSIPKFALSGDMGEIIEVSNRFTFKSDKYKFIPIEISLCKIRLHDYDTIKDIYLYDYPNNELAKMNARGNIKLEIKNHIQIRLRELVDDYLKSNEISIKDVLQPKHFEQYENELHIIKSTFIINDEEKLNKEINTLNAKWKINKKKENYARIELHKNIHSEYFILNEFAFYELGWSLPVKNAYGYLFEDTFLTEFVLPEQNAKRVHQYLYSALSCTHNLYLHNLSEFSPLIGLGFSNIIIPDERVENNNNTILFTLTEGFENEFTNEFKQKFEFENKPISLLKFCEFISNKISAHDKLKLVNVSHFNFQERYLFELEGNHLTVNFSYNNKNEFKLMANQTISDEVLNLFTSENMTKEPYHFINDGSWQSKLFIEIQEKLLEKEAFIYEFNHHDWLFDFKVILDSEITRLQFNYNGDGFVTRLHIVSTTNKVATEKILQILKELVR